MRRRYQAHPARGRPIERSRVVLGLAAAAVVVAAFGGQDAGASAAASIGGVDPTTALDPSDNPVPPSPTATAATSPGSVPAPSAPAGGSTSSRFPGGLMIADRGNGRLLVVTDAGRIA